MFREQLRRLLRPTHLRHALGKLRDLHAEPSSIDDWIDLALDFRGKGHFQVDTYQKRTEIVALANAVAALKPERILEIGTYHGGTLLIWSQLASELVVTCDLSVPEFRIPLYREFAPSTSKCRVVPLEGDSHDPTFRDRVRRSLGGPVDFLFIDGDHSEAGVARDHEMYSDLVRSGGLIAFHDILESQPIPTNEVYHFWKRLRERVRFEEFIDDRAQCGYGIGLVHVE